jgi:benzoyl-CoA reductase subunit A
MKCCVGIDLGSTTTKAVVLGEGGEVLGRGITNSRSNYQVACDVALSEALINARFALISNGLEQKGVTGKKKQQLLTALALRFREQQYREQLRSFREIICRLAAGNSGRGSQLPVMGNKPKDEGASARLTEALQGILARMDAETANLYAEGANRKSDFFRDLAGSRYLHLAEEAASANDVSFDQLAGLFDKAILEVENISSTEESFQAHAETSLAGLTDPDPALARVVQAVTAIEMEQAQSVGTGYGRRTLPFPKEQIRSEILCHGLGAHAMFPSTHTVLDIGGQDTKAIQVDDSGIVTSFQMNDRCAAGCGRYLGYIADEMNLGVHELGPMACKSSRPVRINSTCTVFAGAELRERLSLGEKREDILAGLHRAIILRAMSLLARSGGVADEFTFTGGVAKNEAAVGALRGLIVENYGDVKMNISPDSIFTGALGAALFARREWEQAARGVAAAGGAA